MFIIWAFQILYLKCHVVRKPIFVVSDQGKQNPRYTATEDGKRLEISDLRSRGIVLLKTNNYVAKAKGPIPHSRLRLCFRICKNQGFLSHGSNKILYTAYVVLFVKMN